MQQYLVTCLGLGYIGLPTSAVIAENGSPVNGVDINEDVVNIINSGNIHIIEPGLEEIVRNAILSGTFKAHTRPIEGNVYLIVVPTPFKENHEPDISFVETATNAVIPLLKSNDLFIIESTSPVGTTEFMAKLIFLKRPELKGQINIAYCPERVLPGNVLFELINNDRVIGGIDESSTQAACNFYGSFIKGKLHKTNSRTAEMCKLTENSSRDVQIAFANELSIICEKIGVNVWELIELANKHPRVNILQPGSGVGGHCIAVDPWFIVSQSPKEAKLIKQAREVNDYKADWCIKQVRSVIQKFESENRRKPIVACMGLAFKPNIDDLRESPAKYIANMIMQDFDNEELLIVEPNLKEHMVFKLTDYNIACEKADIIVFLVAHKEFKQLKVNAHKIILDFCGIFKK